MRLLAVLLLLVPAAGAGDRAARRGPEPLLETIDPSAEQCAELATLARGAGAAQERFGEGKRAILPAFRDALLKLRAEVVADRGLDPETMKAASSLKRRLDDAGTRYLKEISAIERAALAVLTQAQRARAGLAPKGARGEIAELKREIAEVHAELHGEAGPLGRFLAAPGAADALAARAEGRTPGKAFRRAAAPSGPLERETRELRREINLWNLVNGLHLTEPQLATIASAARAGSEGSGCERVLATLGPEQEDVLFAYKACLVPPRNLRDPVRAGQADDTTAAEKLLARLRAIPARRYAANEERILDATLRGIEEREGRFGEDDRPWALLLLGRVAREVRAMDDVGFQARASECAGQLAPLYRLKDLKEELRDRTGRGAVLRGKTESFLLDPAIIRVCEQRRAQLRAGRSIVPEGPIERAPRCPGEGECGRP